MEQFCRYCNKITSMIVPLCENCHSIKYEKRWSEKEKSCEGWNPSQDDPWWQEWLTSELLFWTIHNTIPKVGKKIHQLLDGTIFTHDSGRSCEVDIWMAEKEIIVSYPIWISETEKSKISRFENWIYSLRYATPLELGKCRENSSYGALSLKGEEKPIIKWAQCGDWASLVRHWAED